MRLQSKTLLTDTALVLTLLLALVLRFDNLAWNPGWYSDEGSDLNIAHNLEAGHFQYFAISGTPLVAARPPLFHLALIAGFQIWGYDILTARLVVAIANFASIILLFLAAREMLGKGIAVLAAFIFTLAPNALAYFRIAFAYDVQTVFYILCWWMLWKFYTLRRARWLLVASLAAGAAYLTALVGVSLVVCVALVVLYVAPRNLWWSIAIALAPGAIYLGVLYYADSNALLQDLALTASRSGDTLFSQFINLLAGYTFLFNWSPWIALGIIGLFLIESRPARNITLLIVLVTLFNTARMFAGNGELGYPRYLALWSFIALGSAVLIRRAYGWMRIRLDTDLSSVEWRTFTLSPRSRLIIVSLFIFLVLLVPLLWLTGWSYFLVSTPIVPTSTALDSVSVTFPPDAVAVTDFVNATARPNEVVLASPGIAWRINARAADFQQALAYAGFPTENFGASLPRTRFVFDPSFENATFVIVDNLWRGWAESRMPALKSYMQTVEHWQLVMERGEFDVYRNPAR